MRHPHMILSCGEDVYPISVLAVIPVETVKERPAEEDRQMSSNSSATQAAEDPCAGYPVQGGGGTVRYLHARELLVRDRGVTVQDSG